MGGGVVQRKRTLHRHVVEVAQDGLGIGHHKAEGQKTKAKDKGI